MEKLYEARYEVSDGARAYMMVNRYHAGTEDEAMGYFAEEANECYGGFEDDWFDVDNPHRELDTGDGRTFRLWSLTRVLDASKLQRACLLARRYVRDLPIRPMWEHDDRERVLGELAKALA